VVQSGIKIPAARAGRGGAGRSPGIYDVNAGAAEVGAAGR
jgi:hypothetical protein